MAEVVDVSGQKGNFTVTIKQSPRYIDMEKCIACGVCSEKCPKKVDDEFNMGISKRKAAYIQYGQTVPLKYVIDGENCLFHTKGKCRACEKFCPTGAVNFDDTEKIITIQTGAMIMSPGYEPFSPSGYDYTGYDAIPDVVTSLEFERMISAGGPQMGHLVKPSDHREPQKIAWLQCIGSRSLNRNDQSYCSDVCCMYSLKQSLVSAEHIEGRGEQTLFCLDMRTHGKEFEEYYQHALDKGIRIIRARPHTLEQGSDGTGVKMTWSDEQGQKMTEEFDIAVLSVGMNPPTDAAKLSTITGIKLNSDGFAESSPLTPASTTTEGIYVGGSFKGPMGIPRTVAIASGAAFEASLLLSDVKGELAKEKSYPDEIDIADQETRIGVFVCSCGTNISGIIDVKRVAEYAKNLPGVVFVENNMFACSTDTQDLISNVIKENNLNRIVIAACTPRTHEPLFQETLKSTGLNAHMVEMANIRNQNSWVHKDAPEEATLKAFDQVRMAVSKVRLATPLSALKVDVVQKALVIGGGAAGMSAAAGFSSLGYDTVLVEKDSRLGGNAWHLEKTTDGKPMVPILKEMIAKTEADERITVYKDAELTAASGSVGNFSGTVTSGENSFEIEFGTAVVTIGATESVPEEYLYGQDNRVFTHLDFDKACLGNETKVKDAQSIVFIQCVGSRDEKRPYCSRVCCTHSVKKAAELKSGFPEKEVFILYRDIRTYSTNEKWYQAAREAGVIFIRFDETSKPVVTTESSDLIVRMHAPVLGKNIAIDTDVLVLAAAIEPAKAEKLSGLFKFGLNRDGFVNEAHPKLRPVDMTVSGMFTAGLCHYPKPLEEAIEQAKATVARANAILSKRQLLLDPIKSFVTEKCDGCAICLDVCPYNALTLEETSVNGASHKTISSDSALCMGCGICSATCPKGGINIHGFTGEQLMAQVDAVLSV